MNLTKKNIGLSNVLRLTFYIELQTDEEHLEFLKSFGRIKKLKHVDRCDFYTLHVDARFEFSEVLDEINKYG